MTEHAQGGGMGAVMQEREACAKIADPWSGFIEADNMGAQDSAIIKVREDIAAAIRAQPIPGEKEIPADLIQRCKELLQWSATGLLNGGKGGAVRDYADKLKEQVGEHYALSLAESKTRDDAMRALVDLCGAQSQGGAS